MSPTSQKTRTGATLAIVSLALFMVVLDNLVVTVALPAIREDLGATLQSLEWTINAYTLAFAVMLIPGAALGDRFGRRRLFLIGLALFTASSAAAALAPTTGALVAARALQGVGGAIVAPLTLTLLANAFPENRRGAALGIWSGISGTGVALGPIVGGAVVDGISWHWIFWINVPIGLALLPVAARVLRESHGPSRTLDLPGVGLASVGLFALVFGLVRGQAEGWTNPLIVSSLAPASSLLAAFVAWELRAKEPMVPMGLFRKRTFAVTNAVSFFMYFGTFGSIFLLTQVLQYVSATRPSRPGVRMLLWTGATMVVAPIAGVLSERFGSRGFMAAGLALQAGALAWFAATTSTSVTFGEQAIAFVVAGAGMGLVFAPSASALLSVVSPAQAGQASGTNNAIREVGGVFGVAVLATVFSESGALRVAAGVRRRRRAGAVGRVGRGRRRRGGGAGAAAPRAAGRARRRGDRRSRRPRSAGERAHARATIEQRRARSPSARRHARAAVAVVVHAARGAQRHLLDADVGPRRAQADAVLEDSRVGQPRLDRRAAADDLLGQREVGLEAPVVLVGAPAEDDVVAMGEPSGPAGRRLLHEELLQAWVLDDDVLAAHRAHGGVGHQLARTDAAAVDHHRRRARDLGSDRSGRTSSSPPAAVEACEQVVEVARHVDERHLDREGGDEARRCVAAHDVDAGEEERRRPLVGAARGEHAARDAHAGAGLGRERAQVVEALDGPAAHVVGRAGERRAPHRARRARRRRRWRLGSADAHVAAALDEADRAREPDHARTDDEDVVGHRRGNLSLRRMHEPLEGIAAADALLGRPFPLPSAPLPLARWVDVVQVAEHGVEVAWNLDDTRAGAPGRLALYAGLEPAPERDLPGARGGARRGRDRRARRGAARGPAVAAPGRRAALGARRPAPAPHRRRGRGSSTRCSTLARSV